MNCVNTFQHISGVAHARSKGRQFDVRAHRPPLRPCQQGPELRNRHLLAVPPGGRRGALAPPQCPGFGDRKRGRRLCHGARAAPLDPRLRAGFLRADAREGREEEGPQALALLGRGFPPRRRPGNSRWGGDFRRRDDRLRPAQHGRPRALPVRDPARPQARGTPLHPGVLAAPALGPARVLPLPPAPGADAGRDPHGGPPRLRVPRLHDSLVFAARGPFGGALHRGSLRPLLVADDDGKRRHPRSPAPTSRQLNDFPQPQVVGAVGLRSSNPFPWSPSSKSIVVPSRCSRLLGSTTIPTPSLSNEASSAFGSSNDIPYWSPEHPPCSTESRRRPAGDAVAARIERTWFAALGVSRIIPAV